MMYRDQMFEPRSVFDTVGVAIVLSTLATAAALYMAVG